MNSSNKSKIVPIIGILLVLISVGYFFFGRGDAVAPEAGTVTKVKAEPGGTSVQGDLLKTINEIEKLKLNKDVLKSTFVLNSIDFTTILTPEPKVRPNPFAPVTGFDSQNSISTPALAPASATTTTKVKSQ